MQRRAHSGPPGPSLLTDVLRLRAREQAAQRAYVFLDKRGREVEHLTYGELERSARALAAVLVAGGARGERVVLLYPPGLAFVAAFFGCLYAGAVAVPAAAPAAGRGMTRLRAIVEDARPRAVLGPGSTLKSAAEQLATVPGAAGLQWLASDAVDPKAGDDYLLPALGGEAIALIQYTSGSTSTPKGVVVRHRNLCHNLDAIDAIQRNDARSVGCCWLPSFHDMGLIEGVLQPLLRGYPTYLLSPLSFLQRPLLWLQTITRYRVTNSGGPDFAFDLCARKVTAAERQELDLDSWRMAYNGSEPIRRETLERFCEAFGPCGFRRRTFYPVYGLAEATLMVSGGDPADEPRWWEADPTALARHRLAPAQETGRTVVGCGPVRFGIEVAIVDPATRRRCAPDAVGEIWVRGPSVTAGYWNRPAATRETFEARLAADEASGPWLRTGDLGFFADGELFVAGRLKELIIVGGRNHYPQDIERTVEMALPALPPGAAAAFGVEVEDVERVVVLIEGRALARSKPGSEDAVQALVETVRRAVAAEHALQVYDVVLLGRDRLPKTSSGKLQRHRCRQRYLDGDFGDRRDFRAA